MCRKSLKIFLLLGIFLLFPRQHLLAQPLKEGNVYKSQIDQDLTIQKIAVLPANDNLSGIYARPLEDHLVELIEADHQWDYVKAHSIGPIFTQNELQQNPEKVMELAKYIDADAFLVGQVVKGPQGISIKLSFFLTFDGKLFASEEINHLKKFDVNEMKEQATLLLSKIKARVPYDAMILSRRDTQVTVNIGTDDGIDKNKVLSVIQIIKVERHPKFHFIIKTEKEILGKVKIIKAEKTLSFGRIVTEIERGAIQKNSKISGLNYHQYNEGSLILSQSDNNDLSNRVDNHLSFGKDAKAWVPQKPPTFGQVSAKLGLGTYSGTLSQSTPLEAKTTIYPSVHLSAELWINPTYSIHTNIKQGILSTSNPSGGSPSSLSMNLSYYDFSLGYNARLAGLWGPQFEATLGFATYKMSIDDVSNGLTSMTYSGMNLGLHGSFPVTNDKRWFAGADLVFFIGPSLSESPGTSGSSSENTVNQFSLYAKYKIKTNMLLTGSLDMDLYSTKFSGTGTRSQATSASQKHTSLGAGVIYMF